MYKIYFKLYINYVYIHTYGFQMKSGLEGGKESEKEDAKGKKEVIKRKKR